MCSWKWKIDPSQYRGIFVTVSYVRPVHPKVVGDEEEKDKRSNFNSVRSSRGSFLARMGEAVSRSTIRRTIEDSRPRPSRIPRTGCARSLEKERDSTDEAILPTLRSFFDHNSVCVLLGSCASMAIRLGVQVGRKDEKA
ncbi:hypothetical protein BHE74_00012469 [Ensete ventricosum]|nr:hypothetical protein GW17_00002898 [Ensete ventricosum]RWW79253.1 hypothetical protein BHE74_00012469 [Ensete ventricosum]